MRYITFRLTRDGVEQIENKFVHNFISCSDMEALANEQFRTLFINRHGSYIGVIVPMVQPEEFRVKVTATRGILAYL